MAKGRSDRYVSETCRLVRAVAKGVGVELFGGLSPEKVYGFITGLPRSARTKETHRLAVCGMTSWLADPNVNRLSSDPLATLRPFRGVSVRNRRSLDEPDLQRLLDAARDRPLANNLRVRKGGRGGEIVAQIGKTHRARLEACGRERALVYKFAILTLARFGAIRRMTVDALHLDGPHPYAVFPAGDVKKRKEIKKPLPPVLVEDLKEWLARTGKKAGDRVFDLNRQVTRELRKDLEFAGIPYKDSLGRTFDFHCFKKCGITSLARAKVRPELARLYAEHADVRLTLQTYADVAQEPMHEVFAGLPKLK
jgi:integrase